MKATHVSGLDWIVVDDTGNEWPMTGFKTAADAIAGQAQVIASFDPNYAKRFRVVSDDDVRSEAERRIFSVYPAGKQLSIIRVGGEACETMGKFIDAIRASGKALRAQLPIPTDYDDDAHWPVGQLNSLTPEAP